MCSIMNMATMMNSIRATFVLYKTAIEFSRFNTFCSYRSNCKYYKKANQLIEMKEKKKRNWNEIDFWNRRFIVSPSNTFQKIAE